MKKPIVAFLLSFFMPGASLAYLGRWVPALVNVAIVSGVGIVAVLLVPATSLQRVVRSLSFGLTGGSVAYAMGVCKQMNLQAGALPLAP